MEEETRTILHQLGHAQSKNEGHDSHQNHGILDQAQWRDYIPNPGISNNPIDINQDDGTELDPWNKTHT
jgi:hypothetical protein